VSPRSEYAWCCAAINATGGWTPGRAGGLIDDRAADFDASRPGRASSSAWHGAAEGELIRWSCMGSARGARSRDDPWRPAAPLGSPSAIVARLASAVPLDVREAARSHNTALPARQQQRSTRSASSSAQSRWHDFHAITTLRREARENSGRGALQPRPGRRIPESAGGRQCLLPLASSCATSRPGLLSQRFLG